MSIFPFPRVVFSLLVCLCFSTAAVADSYGLTMGLSSEELDTVKDEKAPTGILRLLSVPIPVALYKSYLAQFSDDQGLCWAKGIGGDIQTDLTGTEAKAAFNVEKLRLSSFYGEAKSFDFRFSGSADSDHENWMQAISDGDRYFAAIWTRESGGDLPENLRNVGLVLNASASNISYLSLEYTFENIDLCEQEISQQ